MALTGQILIAAFEDVVQADNACRALCEAGFKIDHVYSSKHSAAGSFLSDLKAFFTGNIPGSKSAHDLTAWTLSDDDAHYYDAEYNAGHAIVAVHAGERVRLALDILQEAGACINSTLLIITTSCYYTDNVNYVNTASYADTTNYVDNVNYTGSFNYAGIANYIDNLNYTDNINYVDTSKTPFGAAHYGTRGTRREEPEPYNEHKDTDNDYE